jgi:NAD-dependent deacetylase
MQRRELLRDCIHMSLQEFSAELIRAIRAAQRVVVLTGAGVSAESGVPTFRDAQTGLWSRFKPEELATPEAFRMNPKRVWEWYAMRRARLHQVQPNPGHQAIVELERRVPEFLLVTQNVDGLHQQAGSRKCVELHGNITRTKCFEENVVVDEEVQTDDVPPRCPRCGGHLRPDVVWFNEMLPEGAFEQALSAARQCELFFSVGTSALVFPAASLPVDAVEAGARLVEINVEPTPLTPQAHDFLQGPSGAILPALLRTVWPFSPGTSNQ